MDRIEGLPIIRGTNKGIQTQTTTQQKGSQKSPGIGNMLAGNTTQTDEPSFTSKAKASSVSTPIKTSTAASVKSEQEKAPAKRTQYTIQKGDTLSALAQRFSTDLKTLQQLNSGVKPTQLKLGQKILVPAGVHTIKQGDTLSGIAKSEKSDVDAIMRANPGTKPKALAIGKNLFVPEVSKTDATKKQTGISNIFDLNAKPASQTQQTPNASPISDEEKASIISSSEEFIKGFEGGSNVTYTCPAGAKTIGYGHKIKEGEDFSNGIDEATALSLLNEDTNDAYNKVIDALGDKAGELDEKQIGALVDLVFNAGAHPNCMRLIKEGKYDEAQKEMDSVNKTIYENKKPIGKEVLSGLIIRRAKDMALFGNGKISVQGKKVLLEKLNKRLGTKYKTLQEAETAIRNKIDTLSKSNKKSEKLNNLIPLFDTINNPQSVVDSF